jgi:hypothetical protein
MNEKNKTKSSTKQNLKQIMTSQTNQFEVLNQDIDSLIQRLEFNDLLAAEQIESNKNFDDENDVVLTSTYSGQFEKRQPIFDMAVLVQCNHSIIR